MLPSPEIHTYIYDTKPVQFFSSPSWIRLNCAPAIAIAMRLLVALWAVLAHVLGCADVLHAGHQPLSRIAIERTTAALLDSASINAHPTVLGLKVYLLCLCFPPLLFISTTFQSVTAQCSLPFPGTGNVLANLLLILRVSAWDMDMVTWWCFTVSGPEQWLGGRRVLAAEPLQRRLGRRLLSFRFQVSSATYDISSCGLSSDDDSSSLHSHVVSSEICQPENWMHQPPYLCTAPIKVISIQYYLLFHLTTTTTLVPYMTWIIRDWIWLSEFTPAVPVCKLQEWCL